MTENNGAMPPKKRKNIIICTEKLLPMTLAVVVLILDQLTKFLITAYIPMNTIGCSFFGDFLRIIHVRNPGIAFSIGHGLPSAVRGVLFAVMPLAVIIMVLAVYFRNTDFTQFQRWTIAGIAGGGIGNLIDRCFRPFGVVDFIDIKFYGLFGLERWPTFNVADMSVLICGILLLGSFVLSLRKESAQNAAG
ncbi:MAG: signal peptidase II [Bacteroides sp.]|nr:signal peptidase II [Prevotella sp.]MCM1408610.1 signal peptidase II [Treponema brennaborense]MCM1468902.1 signal peptidase II [Bacteroides sp.]